MNKGIEATSLKDIDIEVFEAIEKETNRQQTHIELIASENFVVPAIMEAMGSTLTNKYAEGYPGKRYYYPHHPAENRGNLSDPRR